MAKKSELETANDRYLAAAIDVSVAVHDNQFPEALRAAVGSLPHLAGYVDFVRRYLKSDAVPVATIDAILAYAPYVFDFAAVRAVETLFADKKLAKKLGRDVPAEIAACRAAMAAAAGEWDAIAAAGAVSAAGRHALDIWVRAGVVTETSAGTRVAFDARRPTRGLCPACGRKIVGAKLAILDTVTCPGCRRRVDCVLIGDAPPGADA